VEKTPVVIKDGVTKDEAEAFKKLLVQAGAVVELL
jgi:ribosomal protein L7/L12